MNAKSLIAASFVSLVATGAALAQEISVDAGPFVSTVTRAQVLADLAKARSNGQFDDRGAFYAHQSFSTTPSASTKTRAEVKAETAKALAQHERLSQGEKSSS